MGSVVFFFQAEDGIRGRLVTGVQTCALPILSLQGSSIKEAYVGKDGTFYVMVEYPLNSLRQASLNEAKKQEALYNEFKATQGFNELEEAIRDLD